MGRKQRVRALAARLRGEHQPRVGFEQVDHARAERDQPLARRRARPKRRQPADQRVLKAARLLVEQREREPGPIAEAPVERAGADGRGARHVLHRHTFDPARSDELTRGNENPLRYARIGRLTGVLPRIGGARFPSCLDGGCDLPHEVGEQVPQTLRELRIVQRAVVCKRVVGHPDGELGFEYVRARGLHGLAHLGLRPDGAEEPGARAHHGGRLVAQHVLRERPRSPVDRVLEGARQRGVVLGGGDQDRVRTLDRGEEGPNGLWRRVLEVLVERGQSGQPVPLDQIHPGREQFARRPEQLPVVGPSAQAAGDADPHALSPAGRARCRRSA